MFEDQQSVCNNLWSRWESGKGALFEVCWCIQPFAYALTNEFDCMIDAFSGETVVETKEICEEQFCNSNNSPGFCFCNIDQLSEMLNGTCGTVTLHSWEFLNTQEKCKCLRNSYEDLLGISNCHMAVGNGPWAEVKILLFFF
jgi:hypothetical protein